MLRFVRFLGWVLVTVVIVAVVATVTVYIASEVKLKKTHTFTPKPVVIPTDLAAIARGKHIAETRGCNECHGADYGGAKVIDNPAMGQLYGPNLTKGKGGLGPNFRDEDWVRAIRHGVAFDGRGLVLMPSAEYAHFTDTDLGRVIAFLKTVAPVDRERVPISPGPVTRALLLAGKFKLAADEIDHPNLHPATIEPAVTVEYGRYLAVGCSGCHGPNFSGGKIEIGPPDWPQAANLTPHPDGRMAKWTEADFLQTLRTAKRPDGSELNTVMPRSFGKMDDVELRALWAYFKTLTPVATGVR